MYRKVDGEFLLDESPLGSINGEITLSLRRQRTPDEALRGAAAASIRSARQVGVPKERVAILWYHAMTERATGQGSIRAGWCEIYPVEAKVMKSEYWESAS